MADTLRNSARILVAVLAALLTLPKLSLAQGAPALWREKLAKLEVGD